MLILVFMAIFIMILWQLELLQPDIQLLPTRLCMSYGYIPWRRQRKYPITVASIFLLFLFLPFLSILSPFSISVPAMVVGYLILFLLVQVWFSACISSNQSCSLFNFNSGKCFVCVIYIHGFVRSSLFSGREGTFFMILNSGSFSFSLPFFD